jgi:hypothetical protein
MVSFRLFQWFRFVSVVPMVSLRVLPYPHVKWHIFPAGDGNLTQLVRLFNMTFPPVDRQTVCVTV